MADLRNLLARARNIEDVRKRANENYEQLMARRLVLEKELLAVLSGLCALDWGFFVLSAEKESGWIFLRAGRLCLGQFTVETRGEVCFISDTTTDENLTVKTAYDRALAIIEEHLTAEERRSSV